MNTMRKFGGASIQEEDWEIMRSFFLSNSTTDVLEFGSGLSTLLMSEMGICVYSFDTNKSYQDRLRQETKQANIIFLLWNGVHVPVLPAVSVALIDGPFGGANRGPVYEACAKHESLHYIMCHDQQRVDDAGFINMYLAGWTKLPEETKRLGIYKRYNL